MADLKPAHVRQVVNDVAAKRAPRTAFHVYRLMATMLRQAVRDDVIRFDPSARVTAPSVADGERTVPDSVNATRLMETVRGTVWEIPVVLSATTGARRSEVLAIRWADVDLDAGVALIGRGVHRAKGEGFVFLPTKSERSRRAMALLPQVVEALRVHKREQAKRRLAAERWTDHDLVCANREGGPMDPGEYSRRFKVLAKRAGLDPKTRLHDLRHAVGTMLLRQGVHPGITSAYLGHSSPAFTMKQYQHVDHGMTAMATEALGKELGG